jgi:glucokinase
MKHRSMSTGLHSLYPRLLADVGGTCVRLALETAPGVLEEVDVRASESFPSLLDAVRDYLGQTGARNVAHAAIGIATAVTGDQVRMTNHSWTFSIAALRQALGLDTLVVINDFTALALSLPHLPAEQLQRVGGGDPHPDAPRALLGPGTGLGVSGLVPGPDGFVALAGEGGHVGFAPADDEEMALWHFAHARHGHVSAERFLSGPGLALIHEARLALAGLPSESLTAADITRRALGGHCEQCSATLDRFCAMLGSVAGALALTLGARGGVYIGGGIVPRLGDDFARSPFRRRFEEAGRLSGYLAAIPVFVIHSPYPGLIGAQAALTASLREPNHA